MSKQPAKDDVVTGAVLGEWLGLSERTITELAKRGVVAKAGRQGYRLRESVRRYCEDRRRAVMGLGRHAGADADGAAVNASVERRRLAAAQASVAEAKAAGMRDELVPLADVQVGIDTC